MGFFSRAAVCALPLAGAAPVRDPSQYSEHGANLSREFRFGNGSLFSALPLEETKLTPTPLCHLAFRQSQ